MPMDWIILHIFLISCEVHAPVLSLTRYVSPTTPPNPDCPTDMLCEPFQYHMDNLSGSIKNITFLFLRGSHSVTIARSSDINFGTLQLIGVATNVVIHDIEINYMDISELWMENLVLEHGSIRRSNNIVTIHMLSMKIIYIADFSVLKAAQVRMVDTTFDKTLYVSIEAKNTIIKDCNFLNGLFPLSIGYSNLMFSGISRFYNNSLSALIVYLSNIVMSGTISFANNTGTRGGALVLYSSSVSLTAGTNLIFNNNSADEMGGAIYIEPDWTITRQWRFECYFQVQSCNPKVNFYYANNSARIAGDNIYGTSLDFFQWCNRCIKITIPSPSNSSVSSDPTRACICDSNGQPQCKIISIHQDVHPGETFNISAVIVGGDYGITIGTVFAKFMPKKAYSTPTLMPDYQYSQLISNNSCTELRYSIYSEHIKHSFLMYLTVHYENNVENVKLCTQECQFSPIIINFTILPCPSGFTLMGNPSRCDCFPILTDNGIECSIVNGIGYFTWTTTLWISANSEGVVYAKRCPLKYCKTTKKLIDINYKASIQCAFNRAGKLCGQCEKNFSLAIGSSHCIQCLNSNGLALLIFFAASGFLLVLFISVLNLTITKGMINGVIFYANIVWTCQSILFPLQEDTNAGIIFLKTFIAWVNLDFGIETCFVKGLTGYWKTWLQFVFPFYIWTIAGLMIVTAKYSKQLTKLYGNSTVPVLATIILLSYMKFLRNIVTIFYFSKVLEYPKDSTLIVWSEDGNLEYFGLPHTLLLVAALVTMIILWLPYTLTLLCIQQLLKISHLRILKCINNLIPFYDAHFAPFKYTHRYWFGVLLLARGILLVVFASTYDFPKSTYLLFLLIVLMIMLLYMTIVQPYKNKTTMIFRSTFLINLVLLSASVLYTQTQVGESRHKIQAVAIGLSTGAVFLQFCGIVVQSAIALCGGTCRKCKNKDLNEETLEDTRGKHELVVDFSTAYRDSVLSESLPMQKV